MTDSFDAYQGRLKELCAYARYLLDAADADARLLDALYKVMPAKGREYLDVTIALNAEHDRKLQGILKLIYEHVEGDFSRLAVASKYIYSGKDSSGADLPTLSPADCRRIEKELQ